MKRLVDMVSEKVPSYIVTMDSPTASVPHLLFVYGTLRAAAGHPMGGLLRRHAEPAGAATVRGRLYDAGRYPAAALSDDPADRVRGELWRLGGEAADELLRALDRYEGYAPDDEAGSLFVRRRAAVEREDGSAAEAWVYLFNRPVARLARLPSGDWMEGRGAR